MWFALVIVLSQISKGHQRALSRLQLDLQPISSLQAVRRAAAMSDAAAVLSLKKGLSGAVAAGKAEVRLLGG